MAPDGILLYILIYGQRLSQSPSEKLPPQADGSKYRDPQPNIILNKSPWDTQPKVGCLHQIPHFRNQETSQMRRFKECISERKTMKTRFFKSARFHFSGDNPKHLS